MIEGVDGRRAGVAAGAPGTGGTAPGPVRILIFNSFFGVWPQAPPAPGRREAILVTDRGALPGADAVVFHLPTLGDVSRLRKRPGQLWAAWCMESEVTVPALADRDVLRRFDVLITHRRDADIWYPYVGPSSLPALMSPPRPKTAEYPVAHFQSNPYDRSGRTRWAAGLIRRMKVASYGAVLRTVGDAAPVEGRDARLAISATHHFTLAFENSVAPDYVSDKFFDALIAGSVPVYLGAPNVADFAPAPRSYVDVADFGDPGRLAAYLDHLVRDPDAYAELLAWKTEGPGDRFLELLDGVEERPFARLAEMMP